MEEKAQALGISHGIVSTILHDCYGIVSTILHNCLGMHKLTARWVPKSLSDEQMASRASVCGALLKLGSNIKHYQAKCTEQVL